MDYERSPQPVIKKKTWILTTIGTVAVACLVASMIPATTRSTGLSSLNPEHEGAFVNFIAKFGRTYASKDEYPRRFEIFAANLKKILAHNANPEATFLMGVNQFTDRLEEEYPRGRVAPDYSELSHDELFTPRTARSAPSSVNWANTNKVAPALDQGAVCGSCWAFSTANCLETTLAIKNNVRVRPVSIQHLIDCDYTNAGC